MILDNKIENVLLRHDFKFYTIMKLICAGLLLSTIMFSCYEVKRVELSEEVKEELSLTKPMNITDSEISAVANEIGDSLVKGLDVSVDSSFSMEEHQVTILGENAPSVVKDSILQEKFQAYRYSFDKGQKDLSGLVKFKSRSEYAQYEGYKSLSDSTFKMVMIDISVREVTKKIAKDRKRK